MSKERELLEAMRQSLETASGPANAGSAGSGGEAVAGSGAGGAFDLIWDILASMVGDPVFYVKVVAVLILTALIVMLSFELIAGG